MESKGCLVQAAKFKAAEQAGREVNTQFFDHVSGSDHASFNPLALVLSYGEDDDDDDGEDEEFATPGRQDLGNSATESVEPDRAKKVDRTSVLSAASPDLLEGFFSELQSEGLLDGDDDDAAPAEALAQDNDGESATGALPTYHRGSPCTVFVHNWSTLFCVAQYKAVLQRATAVREYTLWPGDLLHTWQSAALPTILCCYSSVQSG
jgi:hypothetical protein